MIQPLQRSDWFEKKKINIKNDLLYTSETCCAHKVWTGAQCLEKAVIWAVKWPDQINVGALAGLVSLSELSLAIKTILCCYSRYRSKIIVPAVIRQQFR